MAGILDAIGSVLKAQTGGSFSPDTSISSLLEMAPTPKADTGGGYSGVVDMEGQPVTVRDGHANVAGKDYRVTNDGSYILDGKNAIVGHLQDGKVMPVDDQRINDFLRGTKAQQDAQKLQQQRAAQPSANDALMELLQSDPINQFNSALERPFTGPSGV